MALLPVAEALARVIEGAEPLPAESVPLAEAEGRVLAEDLVARRTQPPDDVSAMDGYAVRAEDVATAPARLRLIGEVRSYFSFGDERLGQGRGNAKAFLDEHQEMAKEIEAKIYAALGIGRDLVKAIEPRADGGRQAVEERTDHRRRFR